MNRLEWMSECDESYSSMKNGPKWPNEFKCLNSVCNKALHARANAYGQLTHCVGSTSLANFVQFSHKINFWAEKLIIKMDSQLHENAKADDSRAARLWLQRMCIRMQFCASQIVNMAKPRYNAWWDVHTKIGTAIFVPLQIQSCLVVSFFSRPRSFA